MLHNLLKQKNSYYSNLSSEGQIRFQKRLFSFMESKDFIGRHDLLVTDEIKVLISASAIQLTFGLKNYLLSNLHTINVFPRIFYSKLYNTSFKGLTTQGGILSISWDDFKEGYADEHDKINLGLHELAHALNIELDTDGHFDPHFFASFERWKEVALLDFQKLKEGNVTFFRNYGATNLHEFFAVCIEHFFELPKEFKLQLPELYGLLEILLNQDPDNATGDYRLVDATAFSNQQNNRNAKLIFNPETHPGSAVPTTNTTHPELNSDNSELTKFQQFLKHKGVYAAMAITMLGLFAGIPLIIWFSTVILIKVGIILLLIFVCGALGLLQWSYLEEYIDLEYRHYAMYSFAGFGMCLVTIILFLNFSIRIQEHSATYTIAGISKNNKKTELFMEGVTVMLNNNVNNFLSNYDNYIPDDAKKVTVVFEKGVFGFDMVSDCKFQ